MKDRIKNGKPVLAVDARLANREERVGIGNYCREVLRALAPLALERQMGLRVYLDGPVCDGFPVASEDAELCILPAARFWTQRILAKELRRRPPDVFYSPTLQAPWCCSCPLVLTVHDLAYYSFPQYFTFGRRWVAYAESILAAKRATMLVAVSQTTAKDILHYLRVPGNRIMVAPEAPAPQYQPEVDRESIVAMRSLYAIDSPYILYVGRLQPRKNIVRLVKAFEQVLRQRPECPHHLILAGGAGWLYDDILECVRRSPFKERIRFLGHVPDTLLPSLMHDADALALVSLWEGFGLPVVEAMACGAPVIASACSSLAEVADDAALLVDPTSVENIALALEQVMMQPSLREMLRHKGLARASCFTWEKTAQQVLQAAMAAMKGV